MMPFMTNITSYTVFKFVIYSDATLRTDTRHRVSLLRGRGEGRIVRSKGGFAVANELTSLEMSFNRHLETSLKLHQMVA